MSMDFTGLVGAFPINRPLTDAEHQYRLWQKVRLEVTPIDQLSVIRMNSTFLEAVDKWYGWKGFTTAFAVTVLLIFFPGFGMNVYDSVLKLMGIAETRLDTQSLVGSLLFFGVLLTGISWGMFALMRKECFGYTHYPVRYNRKTGMVHYFRPDGQIRSVPWRDVFFTAVSASNFWGARGHVLADDGVTVLDTFAVGPAGMIKSHVADEATGQYEFEDNVRSYWEFIRRYMEDEEGPAEANRIVRFCMPISERKESLVLGFQRVSANFGDSSLISLIPMFPIFLWIMLGRLIAVATCRIPQWPAEIDATCVIEPSDPYAIRGDAKCNRVLDRAAV